MKAQTALALALALTWFPLAAAAQSVAVGGVMGNRALLVIDGQSQMLVVGETARGVRLVQLQGDSAVVERAGVRTTLRAGAAPLRLGAVGNGSSGAREIVIPAGSGGHFVAAGAINGRPTRFMVDTGATTVALGQAEADRIGLDYRLGERLMVHTANGTAPAWRLTLATLRVGEVELTGIDAIVVPAPMPLVLLGNNFLSRFQMRRDNDLMRLELR